MCKGQGCEWYVYLRKIETHNGQDYVVINMQWDHAHTCSQVLDQKWLTAKWLGERYMKKIKANPHIPLAAIHQCIDEDFGLTISRMKAYRAREHALDSIFGSAATQYRNLFYYKAELERTHPDSSMHIHYENTRDSGVVGLRFLRFYYCLGPLKNGWMRLCRPIIFLDACFLRGMYKGQLMTAMGIDPNNGWWPIAWAVTEAESYVQWKWFLEYLSDDLDLHANGPRYVFMSDQQKLTGIPCTHAIATINKNGHDVTRYVSRNYLKSTVMMMYENVIYPINGVDNWPKSSDDGLELAPPRTKRQRGRPKKLRREEPQIRLHANGGESLRRTFVMRCRRCGQEGLNRRTCNNDPRTDARSEVGPNVSAPGPSTRTRAMTQPQRCGRRGDQD
ncbi:uncharacterized protein LOC121760734 [Salvia splendens]|uniref:uncharacterized protein LOC121760734 n=1 Tax=Salvia splendens TaxID=180675 RepID=UPI001C276DBD|nr:uncharacterized protein LOC121760734 [Salvia splendens]